MIIDWKRQIVRNLQMRPKDCKSWNDDDVEERVESFNSRSTRENKATETRTRIFLFLNQLEWDKR